MRLSALVVLLTMTAIGQELHLSGKVTYLSGSTVYTSLGSAQGVADSTQLYVMAGPDTVAKLKVLAVSSKSSACAIVSQKREIVIGDGVIGNVPARPATGQATFIAEAKDSTVSDEIIRSAQPVPTEGKREGESFLSVQGRVSLQYYSAMFDNSAFNFNQPGLVLNLRASSKDVPIRVDLYGNLRTLSRGGTSPFSADAINASRIYRFSVEYDDKANIMTVGRIIPPYAPSIGSIDGVSYARRFGSLVAGASVGFQPPYTLQGPSTDTKKAAFFVQYETRAPFDLSVTGAYARTYFRSLLDREAVSFMVNAYSSGGLSVYGYSDIDLRVKAGNQFSLSPAVSIGSFNVSYRVAEFLSVGVGADASRAVFPFSTVQFVADTLLDRTLRSGASFSVNINLPNGLGVFNTYSPRSTDAGFGQEYMNNTSFYLMNAFSTGVSVRASYTMNDNQFTSSRGYGVNVQRDILGIDLSVRYQQNRYRILQLHQDNTGQTLGADLMALLSKHLSLVTSFDSMRGYGANSYTIFTELSWRL